MRKTCFLEERKRREVPNQITNMHYLQMSHTDMCSGLRRQVVLREVPLRAGLDIMKTHVGTYILSMTWGPVTLGKKGRSQGARHKPNKTQWMSR